MARLTAGWVGRPGVWRSLIAWPAVAPFALWALLRLVPGDVHFRWVQLVAFTPYVALASVVAPLVALLVRRPVALVAGLAVTVTLAACVLPRALSDASPLGSAGPGVRAAGDAGPALRILSANLLYGSVPPAALVDLVRRLRPDVLTLQELTPQASAGLRAAGLTTLLPYADDRAQEDSSGSGIFTRFPLRPADLTAVNGRRQAAGVIEVPGAGPVAVVSVHPCAPRYAFRFRCWSRSLASLPGPGELVRILSGDFNATLDHAPVRSLLDAGYRDAADATGNGLAGTWPYRKSSDFGGLPVPPVTIDHILVDPRVAVRAFGVHRLPETDHRAIFAELVLPTTGT